MLGIVLVWAYPKLSHGDEMPNDVAQALTGLFIVGIHAAQHAMLALIGRRQ